jgi:hypothetical protein
MGTKGWCDKREKGANCRTFDLFEHAFDKAATPACTTQYMQNNKISCAHTLFLCIRKQLPKKIIYSTHKPNVLP